jgi:hypothetical protein
LYGFSFPAKQESSGPRLVAHADAIAAVNLAAGHQVRQRLYEQALDRALQMPRAIPEIGTFQQQELLGAIGDINQERLAGGSSLNTLLDHLKLNVNDPAQFLSTERLEDDDVVQTVDEFRRKLPASSLDSGARNPRA